MNLIPRNSLFDFDSVLDNFWAPVNQQRASSEVSFTPRVDVTEHKKNYEINAELPGIEKKDIEVTLENGILTIQAESRQEEKQEEEGRLIRQERRYGKFVRSFNLGTDVKEKDIKAEFKDGVLKLRVPKVEEKAPVSRRIEIH
ncbi:Hsp20/alpha crystallin family protein [Marinimicrobium sp. ABcell2]|uniref:Hsp20/alpha crystallin family protein n=1 Tax=Marinimicrobium sp. ABcell2 TaxID=3069751 RepID=UPI0027B6EA69|nr:Hsp20/alpha crystallin family protein [Marinimicrobium sp. ABcell2]MDQ2077582.1 Hsp20/alpha crystallin family protein [Marinimicrobium sp. ABcell2]